jgi:DNA helicase-2/ATP-dependent DNA helicase PcrA
VLAGLDSDQRAAVTAPVGIVVVRAGAGSGKTTVLTRRIAWRALSESADIERTLAITFTRQAATEMRAQLLDA